MVLYVFILLLGKLKIDMLKVRLITYDEHSFIKRNSAYFEISFTLNSKFFKGLVIIIDLETL